MKIIFFSIFISIFLTTGAGVLAQNNDLPAVSGIELPSPGITPDSPFYFLKRWKESIQTFFAFGAENKAKQFLHLSEVRLAEYLKMLEKGKIEIAQKTLEKYKKQINQVLERSNGQGTIGEEILKHQEILKNVLEKAPEAAKPGIEKAIEASKEAEIKINQKMEEVLKQIKEGLSKMPPEMKNCIIEKIGADTVNKIESGQDVEIGPEIGDAIQNCAASFRDALLQKGEEGLKQASPGVQNCVKSIISGIGKKIKGGGFKGQSDIIQMVIQNCLPKGTKIPTIPPGGGINMESLKYIEQFYGKSLSPKDLESLKKAQEQLKGIIPPGTEIPSDKKSLNLEDVKKLQEEMQEKMQEEYKKMTPEELEQIKKTQEQQENIAPPEIPGDSSGMGM